MPNDEINPLDALAQQEERALQEQLRASGHSADFDTPANQDRPVETSETLPLAAPETPGETPPPVEVPPVEVPPVAPPPAEVPPPAEAPPGETPEQRQAREAHQQPSWKQLRDAERLAKTNEQEVLRERQRSQDLERRLAMIESQQREAELARQRAEQGIGEPIAPDPVETMVGRVQQLEQELARQREEQALNQQAIQFSREHPDFEQALGYYIDSEYKRAKEGGELAAVTIRLQQQVPQLVRQAAIEKNVTETEAANNIAYELLYQHRRNAMIESCRVSGLSVPEAVYNLAKVAGFQGGNAQTPAAAQPGQPQSQTPPLSAQERVRAEQVRAGSSSVATMTRQPTPPPMNLQSREQLLQMDPESRERLIDKMDREQPGWDQNLS